VIAASRGLLAASRGLLLLRLFSITATQLTLCFKKVGCLVFDNFGKRGPIFKILSPGDL